jgi:hypothetical protein
MINEADERRKHIRDGDATIPSAERVGKRFPSLTKKERVNDRCH